MGYQPVSGETEFGGVGGMFPEQMRAAPTLQQEMWATYATDEGGAVDADGLDKASVEWALNHIGESRSSFSIPGAELNLTGVAPWKGDSGEGE